MAVWASYSACVIMLPVSKTMCYHYDEICDVIKHFTLILLQFDGICVFGHLGAHI